MCSREHFYHKITYTGARKDKSKDLFTGNLWFPPRLSQFVIFITVLNQWMNMWTFRFQPRCWRVWLVVRINMKSQKNIWEIAFTGESEARFSVLRYKTQLPTRNWCIHWDLVQELCYIVQHFPLKSEGDLPHCTVINFLATRHLWALVS